MGDETVGLPQPPSRAPSGRTSHSGPSPPQPLLSHRTPAQPGEEGLKKLPSLLLPRQTTPSSPGGRGGGWEKRAGVMRVNASPGSPPPFPPQNLHLNSSPAASAAEAAA